MLPDHYATLGVAPYSPPAVIRAAYVELLRRYHPDVNPSASAAARARAITAAYAAIGTPDRRSAYDIKRTHWMLAQNSAFTVPPRRRLSPLISAFVGVALLILMIPWLVSTSFIPSDRSEAQQSAAEHELSFLREDQPGVEQRDFVALQAAERAAYAVHVSDEFLSVSPGPRVELTSREATSQTDAPVSRVNAILKQPAKIDTRRSSVEPRSVPVATPAGAGRRNRGPARPQTAARPPRVPATESRQVPALQEPVTPAWMRPLPPVQPAWMRPLPPSQPAGQPPVNADK